MSIYDVTLALELVRNELSELYRNDAITSEGYNRVTTMLSWLLTNLRADDVKAFDTNLDNFLAHDPDSADFLCEMLFEYLNIETRDELSALLSADD
jgi:hypothetical protein